MPQPFDLTGTCLIAAPAMGDARFFRTVVYLCTHSPEGAFGLIVNRPLPEPLMTDVLSQLDLPLTVGERLPALRSGGPVDTARGFVLHTSAATGRLPHNASQRLPEGLALTASTDILGEIARGQAPDRWFLALGYAGWGAGQLENELARNGWLTCAADHDILFDADPGEQQWRAALAQLGVDPLTLSATAGHA